jgi:hypothetical protein
MTGSSLTLAFRCHAGGRGRRRSPGRDALAGLIGLVAVWTLA